MEIAFYTAAAVAIIATFMTITRAQIVHALLYLILSLLAVAVIFYILGAPFAAALEVIIYAGAIMVLFIFVIMMLNLVKDAAEERMLMSPSTWIGPSVLSLALISVLIFILVQPPGGRGAEGAVGPKQVGIALLGPYLVGVELASMLLLAGLAGAYHLTKKFGVQSSEF